MSVVRCVSYREKRLIHESRGLRNILRRTLRSAGADFEGVDYQAEKLNYQLGLDVVGLNAIRIRMNGAMATIISAPGYYFCSPEKREPLETIAKARRREGRRTIVISKHEITGKLPFDLVTAMRMAGDDRRAVRKLLTVTGRVAPDAVRGRAVESKARKPLKTVEGPKRTVRRKG